MTNIIGLSKKGAQLQHILRQAIKEGRSANKTLEMLRKEGLGYRRKTFLADFRLLKNEKKKEDVMQYVPHTKRISKDLYIKSKGYMPSSYETLVEAEWYDAERDEWVIRDVWIRHETRQTPIDLLNWFVDYINQKEGSPMIRIVDITKWRIVRGYCRGD